MKRLTKKADKVSKIYHIDGKDFRYNYNTGEIEFLYEDEVVDSMGCYLEDWEESPETMCEYFAEDLNAQFENFYQFELKDMLDMK